MGSGNGHKVTIDVEFRTKLESMKNEVNSFKKILEGINLDPTRNANFKGMLAKFENEFNKIETRLDRTGEAFDSKELVGFGTELTKIRDTYINIVKEVGKLTGMNDDALAKMMPQNTINGISKATELIKKYNKEKENSVKNNEKYIAQVKRIEEIEGKITDAQKQKKGLDGLLKGKGKKIGSNRELENSQNKLKESAQKLQEIEKKANEIQKKIDALEASNKATESGQKISKIDKDIERLQKYKQAIETGTDKRYKHPETEKEKKALLEQTDAKIRNANVSKNDILEKYNAIDGVKEQIKLENELLDIKNQQADLQEKVKADQTIANQKQSDVDEINKNLLKQNQIIESNSQKAEEEKQKLAEIRAEIEKTDFENLKLKLSEAVDVKGFDPQTAKNVDDLADSIKNLGAEAIEELKRQFPQLEQELKSLGVTLDQTDKEFDETKESLGGLTEKSKEMEGFAQRLKYFFTFTNAVNLFKQAVKQAYEEIQKLDAVMTETAVVTDFSVGDMWNKLPEYTTIANEYGASIQDAYEVMTIFYQQGLETNEVFALGEQTMQMARIAGLDYADAADKMTNALRGFNMELNETNAQRVTDVYSHLAAISASDTEELSTAMTKVASLANSANMEFENTAAFLAQMIETTRESAETAGTALKTVVARFSEVKKLQSEGATTGTDEDGEEIDVNKVGEALRSVGIDLNEFMSGAKGLDDILIELADKWDSLDLVTQRYIATMAAGSRQQSRFLALMNDNERLSQLTSAAYNAEGASAKQFGKTEESLAFKIQNLQNAYNSFVMGLSNDGVVKGIVDVLTAVLNGINRITEGINGFGGSLQKLSLLMNVFSFFKTAFNQIIEKSKTWGQDIGNNIAKGIVNELGMQSKNIENAVEKAVNPNKSTGKVGVTSALTGKYSQGKAKNWVQERTEKLDQKLQQTKGYQRFLTSGQDFSGLDLGEEALNSLKNQDYSAFGNKVFKSLQDEFDKDDIMLAKFEMNPNQANYVYEEIEKQLSNIQQNLQKKLDAGEIDTKYIDSTKNRITVLGNALDNVKQKKEQFDQAMNTLSTQEIAQSYQKLGQALTGISIALGALESKLSDSFGKNNDFVQGLSIFNSGLSSAATTTTMLGMSINGLNSIASNTSGIMSSLAGSLSGMLASAGPYIAAAMIVISVLSKAYEVYQQNRQEIIDNAVATAEQVQSNKELLKSYNELISAYNEGNASKEDLEEKSKELIDTYQIENGELLLMAKNYEEIAAQAENARKSQERQSASALKSGAKTAGGNIKNARLGTDLQQIKNVKFGSTLADSIQQAAKSKGIEVVVSSDGLGNVNTSGLGKLTEQQLLDYYNIVDSQISSYSNLYNDEDALSSWTNYQDKISDDLENITSLLSQMEASASEYVEYDGQTTFDDSSGYKNWIDKKVEETKQRMISDGYNEESLDLKAIENAIINAYADAGDKNMAFWKNVSELNNSELKNYIESLDQSSYAFQNLKNGSIGFSSGDTVNDLQKKIGEAYGKEMNSLGASTGKAVNSYMEALASGENIDDTTKDALESKLESLGMLDEWNTMNMYSKSYAEQSDFLGRAIDEAISKTDDHYKNMEESFGKQLEISLAIADSLQPKNEEQIEQKSKTDDNSTVIQWLNKYKDLGNAAETAQTDYQNELMDDTYVEEEAAATELTEKLYGVGSIAAGVVGMLSSIGAAIASAGTLLPAATVGAAASGLAIADGVERIANAEEEGNKILEADAKQNAEAKKEAEQAQQNFIDFVQSGGSLGQAALSYYDTSEEEIKLNTGIYKDKTITETTFFDDLSNATTYAQQLKVINEEMKKLDETTDNGAKALKELNNLSDEINDSRMKRFEQTMDSLVEKTKLASTNLKKFKETVTSAIDTETNTSSQEDYATMLEYNPKIASAVVGFEDGAVKFDPKALKKMQKDLENQLKEPIIDIFKEMKDDYSIDFGITDNSSLEEAQLQLNKIISATAKLQDMIKNGSKLGDLVKGDFKGTDLTDTESKLLQKLKPIILAKKKLYLDEVTAEINASNKRASTEYSNLSSMASDIGTWSDIAQNSIYAASVQWVYYHAAEESGAWPTTAPTKPDTTFSHSTGTNTGTAKTIGIDADGNMTTDPDEIVDYVLATTGATGSQTWVGSTDEEGNKIVKNYTNGKTYYFDDETKKVYTDKSHKNAATDAMANWDYANAVRDKTADYNNTADTTVLSDLVGDLTGTLAASLLGDGKKDGSSGDKEDDGSSALKSEQDLVNLERKRNKLEKEFQELQKGGIYTAGLQLANLEAQLAVLREEKKVQEQILEDKKLDFEKAKAKVKNVNELIDVNSDGSVTYSKKADALIKSGSLKGDNLENLQAVIEAGNAVSDQETAIEDNMYQQAEVRSQQADVVNNVIDSVQQRVSELISTIGELVSSAYETIKAGLQATVDGFSNFLQRLNVIVDDSIDTESFKTSLDNLQKRNQWELEKLAEKNFTYNLKSVNSQVDLMSNINNQMQNAMTRLVTSQNSIANSYNQISYLQNDFTETLTNVGNGISSAITETVAAIDSVKKKLTDNVIGNFFSDVGSDILDKAVSKIEENKITSTLVDTITGLFSGQGFEEWYNNYKENGSFFNWTDIDGNEHTENNMISQYIGIFTDAIEHLAPEYDYNYNKIDSSELLSLVQSKLELTQTVDDTYSGQLIKALLDYYQEAQDEMQTEVDNINSERQAILDAYDEITEILNTGKEQYGELSQAIYDAIVAEKQALLDELSSLNENISDADSKLIDTLKDNLDKIRQQRDNEEKETELQDKEARLAYLKQDTSGANRQEILKLEKELEDEKQDYTDTLIDQKISELEKQNEEAAVQRQIQIDLLQSEIDNTKGIWEQVNQLMEGLTDLEEGEIKQSVYDSIIKVLKKTDSFQNGSQTDQEDMLNNWEMLMRYASAYLYFDEGKGSSEYAYITAAKDLIDVTGGLPEGVTPGDGTTWEGYESVNALKDAVVDGDKDIKDAVDSVYTTVKDNMLTSEDFGKYMIAATRITGITTTISGSESILTAFLDNITDKGPEVISKATEGAAKIVQAITKAGFTLADVPVEFWTGFLSGDISGAISTLTGGMGEALGMAEEGVFDFIAAISDASLMGLGIIQDSMPAMADMVTGLADYAITSNKWDDTLEENEERKNKVNEVSLKLIEEAKARYGNNEELVSGLDKIYKEMEANKVDGKYTFGSTEALKYYKEIEYWIRLAARKEGNEVDQSLSSQFITTDSSGNIIKKNQEQKKEEEKGKENEEKENEDNNTDIWDKTVDKVSELNEKIKKASLGAGLIHADKLAFQDGDTWKSWEERIKKYAENGEITVDDIALVYSVLKKWDKDNKIGISDELRTKLTDMASNLSNFSSSFWDKINIFFQRIGASIQAILKRDWDSLKEIWNYYDYSSDKNELLQNPTPTENNNEPSSGTSGSDTKKSLIETISTAIKQAFGIDGSKTVFQKLTDKLKEIWNAFANSTVGKLLNLPQFAKGGSISNSGIALTGEEGPEMNLHSDGTASLLGANGPEIANLKAGDQIYTAAQTRKLLSGNSFAINRYAEGTGALLAPITDLGATYLKGNSTEISRENVFNFNLDLGNLTVDSPDRVNEVADKVWNKITTQVSSSIWPFNNL